MTRLEKCRLLFLFSSSDATVIVGRIAALFWRSMRCDYLMSSLNWRLGMTLGCPTFEAVESFRFPVSIRRADCLPWNAAHCWRWAGPPCQTSFVAALGQENQLKATTWAHLALVVQYRVVRFNLGSIVIVGFSRQTTSYRRSLLLDIPVFCALITKNESFYYCFSPVGEMVFNPGPNK